MTNDGLNIDHCCTYGQAQALAAEAEEAASAGPRQPPLAEAEELAEEAEGLPVDARLLEALQAAIAAGQEWEAAAQQCAPAWHGTNMSCHSFQHVLLTWASTCDFVTRSDQQSALTA